MGISILKLAAALQALLLLLSPGAASLVGRLLKPAGAGGLAGLLQRALLLLPLHGGLAGLCGRLLQRGLLLLLHGAQHGLLRRSLGLLLLRGSQNSLLCRHLRLPLPHSARAPGQQRLALPPAAARLLLRPCLCAGS